MGISKLSSRKLGFYEKLTGLTNTVSSDFTFTAAESAQILPQTAIWISSEGITTADAGTTVDIWNSSYGGISVSLRTGAANRPDYSGSAGVGGLPLIVFNGIDDIMSGGMTKGSAWTNTEIGFAGQRITFGTAGDVFVGYGVPNSVVFYVGDNNSTSLRGIVLGVGSAVSTTNPTGINSQWSMDYDGTNGPNIRKNMTIEASQGSGPISRADGNFACLGGNPFALTAFGNFSLQAAWLGPNLDSMQRNYIYNLIKLKTGIG